MKMSIVCGLGLEVRPRLFEGCEYRRTLSSLEWHQTEDVTQLLITHPPTIKERRLDTERRLVGISGPYDIRTQAGHARSWPGATFLLRASVDSKPESV